MIPELELEPCESAALLPAQVTAGMRWDADTSGPRALMLAVLEDAVRCIERGRRRRHFGARRLAAEAETWVRSDDRTYPFSFANITDVLGIDADALRTRLLPVSRIARPDVRGREVTGRSPKAVFRHTDIQDPRPPPRNVWNRRQFVFLNATSTIGRSLS